MEYYKFYFLNNNLICEYTYNNETKVVFASYGLFETVSKNDYRKIKLVKNKAILISDLIEVEIEDYTKVLKNINDRNKIKKLIVRELLKKYISKLKLNINPRIAKILAGCSFLTLTVLGVNYISNIQTDKVEARVILQGEPIALEHIEIIEEENPSSKFISHIENKNEMPICTTEMEYFVNINCEELGYSDEVKYVIDKYGDILDKASTIYGMSANYLTGILTQESRGLVEDNLMQIVNSSHKDEIKYVYNFEKNRMEKNVLTDDPSKYSDDVIIYTPESLKEPYNNIMFGAIIAQDCVVRLNKVNPFSGLNTYNKGIGNQNKIINRIIKDYDMTKDEFLESFDFVSQWLTYDDNLDVGDPYYVENVTRFIPNASTDGIYIKYIKDGEVYTNKIYIDKTLEKNVKKY